MLAVAGLTGGDSRTANGAYPAMDLIAWFVIVPLAFAALVVGIVQSLTTRWGLFRHYWVLAKLLLTLFAAAVLLVKMRMVDAVADLASRADLSGSEAHMAQLQLVVHAAAGLAVLLVPVVLSIYKPRGMTPYGLRKASG